MTPGKLGATLFSMYDGALPGEKTTMIHLFGVKYAAEIRDCGASVTEIVRLSGIDGSYNREVYKGMRLARYVAPLSAL